MSGVAIELLGVSVAGQVTRRYNKDTDRTTLSVSEEQARELFTALSPVLQFFDQQRDAEQGA